MEKGRVPAAPHLHAQVRAVLRFSRIDIDMDQWLSIDEFKQALPLDRWGVTVTEEEAEAEFALIDEDAGGMVLLRSLSNGRFSGTSILARTTSTWILPRVESTSLAVATKRIEHSPAQT